MKEEMKLYPWQEEVIAKYNGEGTVSAVTGAGKSEVGRRIAVKLGGRILICAHRNSILDQWRIIMQGMKEVQFATFQTLYNLEKPVEFNLLIVDEAHRSVSPEFIKLYNNIKFSNILALTATPNEKVLNKCGGVIRKVGYDEAKICPFTVKFFGVNMTNVEHHEYRKLSHQMRGLRRDDDMPTGKKAELLKILQMKRRRMVYSLHHRVPLAENLIRTKLHEGRKILVITRSIKQANQMSQKVKDIPHIVYHSKQMDNLELYRNNKVRLAISVDMLKEGFDDVETDCVLLVSTATTEDFHIQSMGRAIRYDEGKQAEILILIGNETTDTYLLKYVGNYDFELHGVKVPVWDENAEAYYKGKKYHFSPWNNKMWKEGERRRRIYVNCNDSELMKKLGAVKRKGGSFVVTDKAVFVKHEGKIIKVCDGKPDFTVDEKQKIMHENKLMKWEDLFGDDINA